MLDSHHYTSLRWQHMLAPKHRKRKRHSVISQPRPHPTCRERLPRLDGALQGDDGDEEVRSCTAGRGDVRGPQPHAHGCKTTGGMEPSWRLKILSKLKGLLSPQVLAPVKKHLEDE